MSRLLVLALGLAACGAPPAAVDGGLPLEAADAGAHAADGGGARLDAGAEDGDPWADAVVRFEPGPGAGFGQDHFPAVVLGPPSGGGEGSGSLDVLTLGQGGVIELELVDLLAVDGPGVDLLVFENGFTGFFETGAVAVSEDGVEWREFPCAPTLDAGPSRCAGTQPVFANPAQGTSGVDPAVAGGDGFDLAEVGLPRARFVRVRDSGWNRFYGPPAGGFDLDAVAVVHGQRP